MKIKHYKPVLILLIKLLFFNISVIYSQSAVLNNDCSTASLSAPNPSPLVGTWTSNVPAITFANPNSPNTTAFNIPFNTNITFTWTVGSVPRNVTIAGFVYPLASAGVDAYPCVVNTTLSANQPPAGITGIWNRTQGLGTIVSPNIYNTAITGLGPGENVFRWRVRNNTTGCQSEDLVSVFYLPVTASAGTSDTVKICDSFFQMAGNDPASLTIAPNYTATGTWTQVPPTAPGVIADPNSPTTMINGLDWNDNLFRWTVTNGFCTAFDEITIQNNSPANSYAGRDTTVCDTKYFLNGSNPTLPPPGRGTGLWTVISGDAIISNPTVYNTQVTNLSYYMQPNHPDYWNTVPGINRFEWTVTYKGCTRSDIVEVINALPLPANAGIDQTVCATKVNLDALCEGSGSMEHWWTENAPTPTTGLEFHSPVPPDPIDNTFYNSHVSGIQAGTTSFIWWKRNTINGIVCTISDTVQVFSKGLLEDLNAGSDYTYCADTAGLQADPASGVFGGAHASDVVNGYWTITHGAGLFDNSLNNVTTVRNMAFDTNVYRWNVFNVTENCLMSDDVYITNALPSNASAGSAQPSICAPFTTLVANRPERGNGVWKVNSGTGTFENSSCSGDYCNSYVSNIAQGMNTYVWTVTNQYFGPPGIDATCFLTDTVKVTNNMVVPNAGDAVYACADSTDQLQANPLAGETGFWTVAGRAYFKSTGLNTSSLASGDMLKGLSLGKNTLNWTVSNGNCSGSQNQIVWNLSPFPKPVTSAADMIICGDSTRITGNTINQNDTWYDISGSIVEQQGHSWGEWTLMSGSTATIVSPSNRITDVKNIPAGVSNGAGFIWNAIYSFNDYTAVPTMVAKTCVLTDTIVITNNSVFADAGLDQFICGAPGGTATVNLNAVNPIDPSVTGRWSTVYSPAPSSTIVTPTLNTSQVINMANGVHQYQWTVSRTFGGRTCSDNDIVDITVAVPTLANANVINELGIMGSTVEVCSDNATLQADAPNTSIGERGEWTRLSGSYLIADPTSHTTSVRGLNMFINENTYRWTVYNQGCSSFDDVAIMSNGVSTDASVGFDADTSICSSNFQLAGNDPNFYNPPGGYPFKATGQWTATVGVSILNNTLYNTGISGVRDGGLTNLMTWTINKGGCTSSDILALFNNHFSISANGLYNSCDGTIVLNGESPGVGGSGIWTKGSPSSGIINNPSSYNSSISGISVPGNNEYIWTVQRNTCEARDTAIVVNNKVFSNAGPDIIVCNDTASFKGISPTVGTGTWSPIVTGTGGSITITNPTMFNSHVGGLGLGLNRFTWTVSSGSCLASDTMVIVNNAPSQPRAQNDDEICSSSYILQADMPINGTGSWSVVSGSPSVNIHSPFSNITIVDNISADITNFRWTVTKGLCSLYDDIFITNNEVIANAGDNQTLCVDSTQLIASIPPMSSNGTWSIEAGGDGVSIDNSLARITWVKNLDFGTTTFRWTLSKGGCSDFDFVEINNLGVTASGDDITACEMPIRLSGNNPKPFGATGIWTEYFPGSVHFIDDNTLYNARVDGMDEGQVATLKWTVANSFCSADVDVHIINRGFTINAGTDIVSCQDFATVSAENRGTGFWEVKAGSGIFDNSNSANTVVRNLGKGDNVLRWTVNDNGCSAFDEVKVTNNSLSVSAGNDAITCDDFITLVATPLSSTGYGLWSGGGSSTLIVNKTSSITLVNNLQSGLNTFTWSVTDKGCTVNANIKITSNHFNANAGSDLIVATDFSSVNAGLPVTAIGTWIPFTGSGTPDDIHSPTTTIRSLGYGINEFIWQVNWNGCVDQDTIRIIYNPLNAFAGIDTSICTPRVFMKANNPYPFTGKWTKIGAETTGEFGDDTNPLTEIFNIGMGTVNKYRWTVTINGFSTYDEVTVINNQFPLSAGIDRPTCINQIQLAADSVRNGSGAWSIMYGGGVFDNISAHNALVTNIQEGPNIYIWTATKNFGCTNSDTVQISFNAPPTASFVTDITQGCSPLDVQFTNTSSGGVTFVWNFGDSERRDSGLTTFTRRFDAIYDADSVYTVKLTAYSGSGCTDVTSRQITVFRIPKVDFSPSPISQTWPRSQVNFENLSGENYPIYNWNFGDGDTRLDTVFNTNFSHDYQTWGKYTITLGIPASSCPDTASYTIEIFPPLPKNSGGRNYSGCAPFTVKFTNGTEYTDRWLWEFGDGATSDSITPDYTYDVPGRYIVNLYAWGPGALSDSVFIRHDTVNVYPTPVANFLVTPDTVMLPNSAVYGYNRSTDADIFEWNFGDNGNEVVTGENPIHFYTEPGTYNIILRVYTEHGCFDSASIFEAVVVEKSGVCKFPNAFTPNPSGPSNGGYYDNDISNDVFHPVYRGIGIYKLEIFNRWGEKIFESDNPAMGWDGYRDKKLLPMDVYVWKVTGKYKNGVPFKDAGDVTLIR